MTALELNTAAWYGDLALKLELPSTWQAQVHRPTTGPALTDDEIRQRSRTPTGNRRSPNWQPVPSVPSLSWTTSTGRLLPPW